MFSSKYIGRYALAIVVLGIATYYGTKIKDALSSKEEDDYKIIKKFLLNDSPLYGYNKPKIWIHTKYEVNARKWRDFYSRNTTDLNQPYIHITIKSIIDKCGDDFHICLIDDESFSKLIPSWDIHLSTVAEPMRSQLRQQAMAQLLYYYGGLVVPNSFLCLKNLKSFYEDGISGQGGVFVTEQINRTCNMSKPYGDKMQFIPDTYIMGSCKNNETIRSYIDFLKARSTGGHFTNQYEFLGDINTWAISNINNGTLTCVDGELVGVKTLKRKPILIEDLLGEGYLDISPNAYGIYIPEDELLKRPKYQWFAVLTSEQIFETNAILVKYMKSAVIDTSGLYHSKSSELRSVVSI